VTTSPNGNSLILPKAREDYAKLDANTSGPSHQGQTSEQAQAALDEIDSLRLRLDEAEEKIAFLGAGCLNLTREELIQRITAVGPERWKAGHWLNQRVDKAVVDRLRRHDSIEVLVQIPKVRELAEAYTATVNVSDCVSNENPVSHEWRDALGATDE